LTDYRITCVTTSDKARKDYKVITSVGGPGWTKKTVAQVITAIIEGNTFHVLASGNRVDVIAYPKDKPQYIRTAPDGTKDDNLLSQPDCP
jgi:hypothetical protein